MKERKQQQEKKPQGKAAGNSPTVGKQRGQATRAAQQPPKKPDKTKTPPKRKNVSQTIPNGRTLQTRDEYLGVENKDYRKPGYDDKGNYRKVAVVDSNRDNELVVVKLTTSKKGIPIKGYKGGKSKYRPIVFIEDNEGNPIKPGKKFVIKASSSDLPLSEVTKIKITLFGTSKPAKDNRQKSRRIKDRK